MDSGILLIAFCKFIPKLDCLAVRHLTEHLSSKILVVMSASGGKRVDWYRVGTFKTQPIRLDVYTRDRNRIYDAEMQNLNHQAVEKLELPKRSRFYQSAMDMDHLDKGKSYRELPEGKVLFICTFDPFGLGYVKYSFQNRCEENQELCLRDGTEKIFYNCVSSAEEVPEHLKELYDYIRTGRAESALTRKIEEAVGRARRNEEWRTQYMKELLHDDDVREEGRAEGRAEERSLLLTLIPRMTAGGDGDKIAQLESPEVLEAMQRKYGLNFATLQDSGKKV